MPAAAADAFLARRLHAQRLSSPMPADPAAVVGWFGAVQAQDFQGAKWGLRARAPGLTDARLDAALADGSIIRTHGPRPTWHFIAATDIRWVLAAVAPRVHARSMPMYRACEVDAALMRRAFRVFERTLGDGRFASRAALAAALGSKGIAAAGVRLAAIVMWAELEQVICSGPRIGKQFTYALFDERVPDRGRLSPEEARTALAARYVASHGPVTIRDFVWWSGLTTAQARAALDAVSPALAVERIGEGRWWSVRDAGPPDLGAVAGVRLLPIYDEYFIAYRDREATAARGEPTGPVDGYAHWLCLDGRFGGFWRRTIGARRVEVEIAPYRPFTRAQKADATRQAEQHAAFLGLPLALTIRPVR
jgi:hypothetical protein